MSLNYPNTLPGPADSTNILLGKILQRLGSFAEPGDGQFDLLHRLLVLLNTDPSGVDFSGDVNIGGTLTCAGDVTINADLAADHVSAICTDSALGNHAAIMGTATNNYGVAGFGLGGYAGVYGSCATGAGVYGASDSNNGVNGFSHTDAGVEGESDHAFGVRGIGSDAAGGGVLGEGGTDGIGVSAESEDGTGLYVKITGTAAKIAQFFSGVAEKAYLTRDGLLVGAGSVPTPTVNNSVSGNTATDCTLGCHFRYKLTGNITLTDPTGAVDGQRIVWELIQDGTGSRLLTALGGKFTFGTDIPSATLTTTINKRDFLTAVYNATADKFYIVAFVKGY